MSKLTKIGYDISDISLIQNPISPINHRHECNPYRIIADKEMLPVIVAPMASVTDETNYQKWIDNKFMCVVPRSVDIDTRINLFNEVFVSFSLDESENILLSKKVLDIMLSTDKKMYICIDIAHGTMSRLYDVCKNLKKIYDDRIEIMTGNIATPEAYFYYADAGIDYVRVGIGKGSRCLTSSSTGVYYSLATLLDELNDERIKWENIHNKQAPTKIIADGGIRNYDDINKCLALGADFVMCGNVFAKSWEASGLIFYSKPEDLNDKEIKGIEKHHYDNLINKAFLSENDFKELNKMKPYRTYFGMSCEIAQKLTGGDGNKTSEGFSKPVEVKYHINEWGEKMKSYLTSAMSYCGTYDLDEFKNNSEFIINYSGNNVYKK